MTDTNAGAAIKKFEVAPGIIEVKRSSKKLFWIAGLCIVMTGVSLFLLLLPSYSNKVVGADNQVVLYLVGGIGTTFFGLTMLLILRKLMQSRGPALRLSAEGMCVGTALKPLDIPWRVVRAVSSFNIEGTDMVTMRVTEEDYLALNRNSFQRKMFDLSAKLVGYPCLTVTAQTTQASHEELLALVTYYAEKFSPHMRRRQV